MSYIYHRLNLRRWFVLLMLFSCRTCWSADYTLQDLRDGAEKAATLLDAVEVSWSITAFHGDYPQGVTVAGISRSNSTKTTLDSSIGRVATMGGAFLKVVGSTLDGVESTKCTNPHYAFALERKKPLNSWVIRLCERHGDNNQVDQRVLFESRANRGTLLASHYVNLLPLGDFLKKPGVEVKLATPHADDRGRVRVEFKDPSEEPSMLVLDEGYFYCDPKNGWAIDELHGFKEVPEIKDTVQCHRLIEWGATVNGFPTAKTQRNLFERKGWTWGYIFETVVDDAVPTKEEFFLGAYGFPEPVFARSTLFGAWTWYLLGAVCCAGVVHLLRRRAVAN